MKENIKIFKEDIKKLSQEQRELKAQRKTVNLKVERKVDPSEASDRVVYQKHYLRLLHAAYGLMRGKTFEQIESKPSLDPLENYTVEIQKLVKHYEEVVCPGK